MKIILYLLIATSLMLSCKDKVAESNPKEYLTSDVPEDFLGFYLKFHSDSSYQMEHIVFPLKQKEDGTPWNKDEWSLHKPFNDHKGQYSQSFVNMNGLIIEFIKDTQGIFSMERRFMKAGTGYNLIYYKIENILNDSEDWEAEPS